MTVARHFPHSIASIQAVLPWVESDAYSFLLSTIVYNVLGWEMLALNQFAVGNHDMFCIDASSSSAQCLVFDNGYIASSFDVHCPE